MISIIKKYGQCFGLILVSVLLVAHGGGIPSESEYQCDDYLWIESNSTCTNGSAISQLQGKTKIDGNLVIYGAMPADLSALSELQTVGRDLVIRTTAGLVNLHGLEKLRNIGGKVVIESNYDLKSLTGLNVPEQLKGLTVQMNGFLQDLNGVGNLKIIEGDLKISNNANLSSINGLKSLESVSGSVSLEKLVAQADLYELRKIKKLGGSLTLNEMPALANLNGLESLEGVAGSIRISKNTSLTAIDRLLSLVKADNIFIADNTALKLISFNDNVKLSWLEITGNTQLETLLGANNLAVLDGFKIERSPMLSAISGFYGLTKIINVSLKELDLSQLEFLNKLTSARSIQVASLPKLTYFPEMPMLLAVDELGLHNLPELTDLGAKGKSKLVLSLSLTQIDKLVNLSSAAGMEVNSLGVGDNPELMSLAGISMTKESNLSINIWMENNPKLVDISIFEGIKNVYSLDIVNNDMLTSLPFSQLLTVTSSIKISGNSELCQSDIDTLLQRLKDAYGGSVVYQIISNKDNKACK